MPETTTAPASKTTYAAKPPAGQTYNGKPPSGPACDDKPSVPTYNDKPGDSTYVSPPTTGTPYDGKPPSVPKYDDKPPSTYDSKPPVDTYTPTNPPDTTYGGKPPSGPDYTPTAPYGTTYDSKPPSGYAEYNSKPSYGGYKREECTCGTDIPEDCSCTPVIKIKGRIREHIKNCSYEFTLPCNSIAVMYGVRTAIYEQIVNITIRRKNERKPYKEWTFEGKKDSMLLNLEGTKDTYNLNVLPENTDRVVVVTFQSYSGNEYRSSDMRYKEIILSSDKSNQCSYFYTFFVEAGDDCDYHDTDFCISVLPSKK